MKNIIPSDEECIEILKKEKEHQTLLKEGYMSLTEKWKTEYKILKDINDRNYKSEISFLSIIMYLSFLLNIVIWVIAIIKISEL